MQKYIEYLEDKKDIDSKEIYQFKEHFLNMSDILLQVFNSLLNTKPLDFIKEKQDSPYAKASLRKSVLEVIKESEVKLPTIQSLFHSMEYSISGAAEAILSDQIKCHTQTSKNAINISITRQNVTNLLSQLSNQHDNTYNMLLMQRSEGLSVDKRQIKNALNKLIKERKEEEKNRHAFIQSAKRSENLLAEDLKLIAKIRHTKNSQMIILIKFFGDVLRECGRLVNTFSQPTIQKLNSTDPRGDFGVFVDYFRIARYDLDIKPFIPIDLSHQAFQGLEPVLKPLRINALPVAAGVALFDFEPESGNEIGLQKNRLILLCHPTYGNEKWVLALRPGDLKPGYVPRAFVKTVGSGLGVIFRECNVKIGSPVAIKTINQNKLEASVIDLSGSEKIIPSKCMKIIGGEPLFIND